MMSAHPIFFTGTGHGAVAALRSLIRVFPSLEIVAGDPNVAALARPHDRLLKAPEDASGQLGIMAGHLKLLTPNFLSRKTVLNVHYSLLPKYRGLHAVAWAMLNCEPELGWSVHVVNEYVDDGPIVFQRAMLYRGETSAQIMAAFDSQVESCLGGVIEDYLSGRLGPVPQDRSRATWVPRRNRESCVIDFRWPADRLSALFKVLVPPYPFPILRTQRGEYNVIEADVVRRDYFCDLGRIVNIDSDGVWIKCADSLLVIRKLESSVGRTDARELFSFGSWLSK